eukprot:4775631-Amphidinium_carterae.1
MPGTTTNSVAYMTSVLPTEPCTIEPRHSENLAESHSVKMELLSKRVEDLCRKVRERDCHRVLCLSSETPPASWGTICGWNFSSKSA